MRHDKDSPKHFFREFTVRNEDKWMHQNRVSETVAYFEGVLLDNFVVSCKRGYAAVYERYVNPNQSEHVFVFAPYRDRKAVMALFDEFERRQFEAEMELRLAG